MLKLVKVGNKPLYLSNGYKNFEKQKNSSLLNSVRSFWGFSNKNDNNDDSNQDKGKKADEDKKTDNESKGSNNSLVYAFGDHSPTPNPVLILPTHRRPLFPGYLTNITIKNEDLISKMTEKPDSHSHVGVFLIKDHEKIKKDEYKQDIITDVSAIYKVGTFASIQSIIGTDLGTQLVLMGQRRMSLIDVVDYGPPLMANVDHWRKQVIREPNKILKAYMNEVMASARDLIKLNPLLQEQLQQWIARMNLSDPFKLADFAASLTTAEGPELQRVLEAKDAEERLSITLELLASEKELAKLQNEINRQVEEKISKQQREYFLREQLKNIKKELGMEKDDKEDLLSKYKEKLEEFTNRHVSEETLKPIRNEVVKLESLEKNSPEYNVTRAYLDWLVAVPWGNYSNDALDLESARDILDEDHFGMKDVKERILEFIAVGKLKGTIKGKILCLVGPPGVGKTSIAQSIARALDKKFYRFSVGGLNDTAEVKGHRRTYIGAMPGKPIQCIKSTGTLNPLILIDEIDKVGRSYNGDPSSALLELLDPNQNASFVDHYLDVPVDFSNVLFVCTANDESTIPGPLLDRMEVIRLSGYDIPEKVAIATRYLVPKAFKSAGLLSEENPQSKEFSMTEEGLSSLIKHYCRESGVRSLEKYINKVARKLAYEKVESPESYTRVVSEDNLEKFAGKPIFTQETIYESNDEPLLPGIVMGLAWNPLGGSAIFIETAAIPIAYNENNSSVNVITGQLGSVMKESVNIAYTHAKKYVAQKFPENKFFNSHQIHLHVPEGAVSKDGPSAGVAMTTSLISLATSRPLIPRVAMTGELSLTGKVLPVGGIKEKTLAARRSGAHTVILPAANKRDFDDLPDYVKKDMQVHFATDYEEVYNIVFPP